MLTMFYDSRQCLLWTVEWVHPDGRKELGNHYENEPVSKIYTAQFQQPQEHSHPKKMRKPNNKRVDVESSNKAEPQRPPQERMLGASSTEAPTMDVETEITGEVPKSATPSSEASRTFNTRSQDTKQRPDKIPLDNAASKSDPQQTADKDSDSSPTKDLSFYLHSPSLPSKHPVLIALSSDTTLAACLPNRLVLEFPTIYVLHDGPEKLPEGHISEEDFMTNARKHLIEEVVEEGGLQEKVNGINKDSTSQLEDGEVDEGRLLEVLRRDVKGISGVW